MIDKLNYGRIGMTILFSCGIGFACLYGCQMIVIHIVLIGLLASVFSYISKATDELNAFSESMNESLKYNACLETSSQISAEEVQAV